MCILPMGESKATIYLYCSSDYNYESLLRIDDAEELEHCFETLCIDEKQATNKAAKQTDEDAGYESEVERKR